MVKLFNDLATQTRQVFENIKIALEMSDLNFNDVAKLTFFLTDISQMAIVRENRSNCCSKLILKTYSQSYQYNSFKMEHIKRIVFFII